MNSGVSHSAPSKLVTTGVLEVRSYWRQWAAKPERGTRRATRAVASRRMVLLISSLSSSMVRAAAAASSPSVDARHLAAVPRASPPRRSLRSTPTGTPKAGGSRRLEPLSVTATVCGAYDPSLAAYIDLCLSCRRPTSLPRRLQLARRTSKQYLITRKQRTAYHAYASTHASRQALWLSEPVEPNSLPFSIERTHCWNSSRRPWKDLGAAVPAHARGGQRAC